MAFGGDAGGVADDGVAVDVVADVLTDNEVATCHICLCGDVVEAGA